MAVREVTSHYYSSISHRFIIFFVAFLSKSKHFIYKVGTNYKVCLLIPQRLLRFHHLCSIQFGSGEIMKLQAHKSCNPGLGSILRKDISGINE